VPDDFHREGLGIEVDFSLPAERLIPIVGKTIPQILFRPSSDWHRIIAWPGKPFTIRVDNGPEYIRETLMKWAEKQRVAILHIQPGQPRRNA